MWAVKNSLLDSEFGRYAFGLELLICGVKIDESFLDVGRIKYNRTSEKLTESEFNFVQILTSTWLKEEE